MAAIARGSETKEQYARAMEEMVQKLHARYPKAGIVLISGKVNNPRTLLFQNPETALAMEDTLISIAGKTENCVAVGGTRAFLNILRSKEAEDYLSNNINHANDYWAMILGQQIAGNLTPGNLTAFDRYDLDRDGSVGVLDLILLKHHLIEPKKYPMDEADLNGDGEVTAADVAVLRKELVRTRE